MSEALSSADSDALRAHLDARLGDGFSLLELWAVGGGARDAALGALVETLDQRADLWQVDLSGVDPADPVAALEAAIGDLPDHPWVLCLVGLEELARDGHAAAILTSLATHLDALAERLPGLWVLATGPESSPALDAHAAPLRARIDTRITASWSSPKVHTAAGLLSEASPMAVALRPGAEFWVRDLAPELQAVAKTAGDGEVEAALNDLQKLQVSANLEIALSPALELLRAEIELAVDRPDDAARRLESVAKSLDGLPEPSPEQRHFAAVCLFDLAVARRILGDIDAARTTLDEAEARWTAIDPDNTEMLALILRERGMNRVDDGELRAALEDLEQASESLEAARGRIDLDATVALVHVAVALDERKVALAGIKSTLRSLKKEPQRRQDRVVPLVLLSRGIILLREGDQRGASKALLGCVDGAPALGPSADLLRLRALTLLPALLLQEGRGDEALEQFEAVFSAIEEQGEGELLVEALLEGSSTAIDLGELAVAIAWAREGLLLALRRAPERPDLLVAHAHLAAGAAHFSLGESAPAAYHLGEAQGLYDALVSNKAPVARAARKLLERC